MSAFLETLIVRARTTAPTLEPRRLVLFGPAPEPSTPAIAARAFVPIGEYTRTPVSTNYDLHPPSRSSAGSAHRRATPPPPAEAPVSPRKTEPASHKEPTAAAAPPPLARISARPRPAPRP